MLKTVGRQDDGIAAYRKAIALNPALGEAWWSLANLKTVKFTTMTSRRWRRRWRAPSLKDDDRFHLDFALGKALHDLGRSDEAFAHYAAGNALRRKYHPFDAEQLTKLVDRSIELFTAEVFAERRAGCDAPRSDLHRRHAARRIDADRADPVVAQPGRGHVGACPTCRRSRAVDGNYPDVGSRRSTPTSGARLARNI